MSVEQSLLGKETNIQLAINPMCYFQLHVLNLVKNMLISKV